MTDVELLTRIYLAGPYSHKDERVRKFRAKMIDKKCAELINQGYCVFSPISHSHTLVEFLPFESRDWDFWKKQDYTHLMTCQELHVFCLPGWNKSRGVNDEIRWAVDAGMKIVFHTKWKDLIEND